MTEPIVHFYDFAQALPEEREPLLRAVARVLETGGLMAGEDIQAFEAAFAAYQGLEHCICASSGTDALHLLLTALELKRPDTVLTAPNVSPVVADAVTRTGPRLDFVDVNPQSGLMDPQALDDRLADGSKTPVKAVIVTHPYGNLADMEALNAVADRRGVVLLEDARQAHGSRQTGRKGGRDAMAGSMSRAGVFSFSPEKNLAALGQGGAVVTADEDLAKAMRQLRSQGLGLGYAGRVELADSQLDAVQAAVLLARLPHLGAGNEARRAVAARYDKAFKGTGYTEPVTLRHATIPNRHIYAILVPDREDIRAWLTEQGVCAGIHYPVPLHLHPRMRKLGFTRGDFPGAEQFAQTTLSLPIRPGLSEEQIALVIDSVRSFGGSMR